jgi:hypothetical protein
MLSGKWAKESKNVREKEGRKGGDLVRFSIKHKRQKSGLRRIFS